jgi:hypothetical protein
MNISTFAKAAFGLVVFSGACLAESPAPKVPEEVYAPLKMEEGTWDAAVTFYENDKPSGTATGVQVNRLLENGHWIVNEFRIPATEKFPAYEGHGVWGYDPVAKTYVDTWVDTNDVAVRTDYGYWNAKENTMIWSSKQSDGKGHFVDYRMTEEFKGDTRIFTFYQLGIVKPAEHVLVKIVFTKRKA